MKFKKIALSLISLLFIVGCKGGDDTSSSVSSSSEAPTKMYLETLNITKPIQTLSSRACPSLGKVKALVVNVNFTGEAKNVDSNLVKGAFGGSDSTITPEWKSIKAFYKESSYDKLDFDFVFEDNYTPSHPASYYGNKANFNGDDYNTNASRALYKEILEAFDSKYDYSQFDSNNDGIIDAIFMIYNHPVDYTYKNMFWWAYTSWYEENDTFDNMKLGNFVWCGQDFFTKDNKACNTQTIIHETSHLFGIDDYYDYDTSKGATKGGLAGADLMDNNGGSPCGDHNAYSKALLGWTSPKLLTLDESQKEYEVTLKPFEDNGDTLILTNSFDKEKELFQEYFMLEYYTPTKLMENDKPFSINGIRVLHVSSGLTSKGKLKYDNTSSLYKLISQITTSNGGTYINESIKRDDSTLFITGESLEKVEYNNGDLLKYKFDVLSTDNNECKIKVYM